MTKLEHGGLLDSASIAVADFLEIAAQSVHGHKAIPEWKTNRWLIEYYKDQVEGSREFNQTFITQVGFCQELKQVTCGQQNNQSYINDNIKYLSSMLDIATVQDIGYRLSLVLPLKTSLEHIFHQNPNVKHRKDKY